MSDGRALEPDRKIASSLEAIKHVLPNGAEYWFARDLMSVLGYDTWRRFEDAIKRAKEACEQSEVSVRRNFADIVNKAPHDIALTRYAAYLVAMNGDTTKPQIASAQTYFAVQTRKQEIAEQQEQLDYDAKRLEKRERVRRGNDQLGGAAKQAGVQRYGLFQDFGYRALYGGKGVKEIKQYKEIPEKDELLDRAGLAELAANEFRITQTAEALAKSNVTGEQQAFGTHERVGGIVRRSIAEIGGTMPEDMPPEQNIKKLKAAKRKQALPPANQ